ncbi:sensor histidine kinase [Nannocystaceae bacterium ST9]
MSAPAIETPSERRQAKLRRRIERREQWMREHQKWHDEHHARHGHHGPPHRRWPAWAWWIQVGMRRRLFRGFSFALLTSAALAWSIHALFEASSMALALSLGAGLLMMWTLTGMIAWRITRPMIELVSVARDLGEGRLDRRMQLNPYSRHRGEIAVMARSINTMAERIERQIADQRELLAGVSHELRTPLGHLRVLIDTAREREAQSDPRLFDELEREVLEIDELVDQLLVHSRLEFDHVDRRTIDPVALAVRALERAGIDASKLDVQTEVESIAGDPTLLGRALANLIANARAHGRGLEALRVREGEAGETCFEVEDRGPGFAPGETDSAFAAFVQGRERQGGSLGLGLSLVRRIAAAHGGRTWARNRTGTGACVGFSVGPAT